MRHRFPPFQGEPKWYQFKKICTGHIEYWPERFVQECVKVLTGPAHALCRVTRVLTSSPASHCFRGRDIVCALLQTDESRRLGLLSGGVRDIKAHPFYAGLDWTALSGLQLQPPFKPNEHEWGQATTSPADSKRITMVRTRPRLTRLWLLLMCGLPFVVPLRTQELKASMEHDQPVSAAQQDVFKGW